MVGDPLNLSIELSVNGEKRQVSNSKKMLYSPADIISFASGFMTLEKGDVFMTGTPEGVGKVVDGDILEARIENLPPLDLIVRRK
jgi:2-keto-4-pentenoate hydratase/2-oxohepta-3-ene-1,7-dioic acid hydratase in catechol pathway